jgi:hypothetical protein
MHLSVGVGGFPGTPDKMLPPKKRSTSDAMYEPETKELIVYAATKCKCGWLYELCGWCFTNLSCCLSYCYVDRQEGKGRDQLCLVREEEGECC